MTKLRTVAPKIFLLAMAISPAANAFFDPPTILPANPLESQPIFVQIRGGECDFFEDEPNEADVVRIGQAIQITIDGFHADDPMLCFPIFPTWTYPIGSYPPGTYTLEVIHRYDYPGGPILQPIGTVAFTVGALPHPVPVTGAAGLGTLVIVLLAGGAAALQFGFSRRS